MAKDSKAPAKKQTEPASDPRTEALQRQLVQEGYLADKEVDGRMGAATQNAIRAREAKLAADRAAQARDQELAARNTEAQASKVKSEAEAAALASETGKKQRFDEQASSALGLTAKSASNLVAPAAGTAVGMALGGKLNDRMDIAQTGRNKVLQGVAADRLAGLTTREGAREGARLAGAMPQQNMLLRSVTRMAPHLGLGAISMGKGAQILHDSDPNGEYYSQMADRAAGLGYIGTGAGLMKQGLAYTNAPGVTPDAQAIAVINSNQLRRNPLLPSRQAPMTAENVTQQGDLPSSPAVRAAARPGTHAALKAQAQEMKIPGRSTMGKAELANAVADAIKSQGATRAKRLPKVTGGLAGPAIAAGIAYAASPDQAQAADGSALGTEATALANAGIAGGISYGVQKGIEALPGAAGKALGMAGGGMAPSMIDSMTDYSPDEMAQGRNMLARNLPSMLRGGAVEDAYQIAQVPEPSPMRQAPEMSFDDHMAELQGMLAQMGQDDGPMDNAVASQRVAAMPPQQDWSQAYAPQNRLLATR